MLQIDCLNLKVNFSFRQTLQLLNLVEQHLLLEYGH
jgi:hypothetical protein